MFKVFNFSSCSCRLSYRIYYIHKRSYTLHHSNFRLQKRYNSILTNLPPNIKNLEKLRLLRKKANNLYKDHKFSECLDHLKEAKEIVDDFTDSRLRAFFYFDLGLVQYKLGKYEDAKSSLSTSFEESLSFDDGSEDLRHKIMLIKGDIYAKSENKKILALKNFKNVLQTKNFQIYTLGLLQLGEILLETDAKRARNYNLSLLSHARKNPNLKTIIVAMINIGICNTKLGNGDALKIFKDAHKLLYSRPFDDMFVSQCLISMAHSLIELNETNLAHEFTQNALQRIQNLQKDGMDVKSLHLSAIGALIDIYRAKGEYDKAFHSCEECFQLCEKYEDYAAAIRAIMHRSIIENDKNYEKSIETLNFGILLCDEEKYKTAKGIDVCKRDLYYLLGKFQQNVGKFEESVNSLKQALKLDDVLPQSPRLRATIHYHLSTSLYHLNRLDEAESVLLKVIEFEDVSFLQLLANIYAKKQEFTKSLNIYLKLLKDLDEKAHERRVIICENIAAIYYRMKQYDKAMEYYKMEMLTLIQYKYSQEKIEKCAKAIKICEFLKLLSMKKK